jgi:hypothetical protein
MPPAVYLRGRIRRVLDLVRPEYIRSDIRPGKPDRVVLEAGAVLVGTGCGPPSRRPAHELTAAIRANEGEGVGACAAESAFIAADIGL